MTDYLRPAHLEDALSQLGDGPWQLLAGGTDLYPATQNATLPGDVLDLTAIPALRGITPTAQGLRIGACTTWAEIARADVPPALRALQQAATEVGGRQIQNAGTIGGNLCNASPAADGVPPLLAVDAQVELCSKTGSRLLALSDFLIGPRRTALHPDEVMTAILIPESGLSGASHFLKLGARAYLVISIAMVAVRLTAAKGHITGAALAVGACSATAQRIPLAEAALIGLPQADAPDAVTAETVATALSPLDDLRATAAYRHTAATELLRRAIAETCKALS